MILRTCMVLLCYFVYLPFALTQNETTAWRLSNGLSKSTTDSQTQSDQFTYLGCARKFHPLRLQPELSLKSSLLCPCFNGIFLLFLLRVIWTTGQTVQVMVQIVQVARHLALYRKVCRRPVPLAWLHHLPLLLQTRWVAATAKTRYCCHLIVYIGVTLFKLTYLLSLANRWDLIAAFLTRCPFITIKQMCSTNLSSSIW